MPADRYHSLFQLFILLKNFKNRIDFAWNYYFYPSQTSKTMWSFGLLCAWSCNPDKDGLSDGLSLLKSAYEFLSFGARSDPVNRVCGCSTNTYLLISAK